MYMHIYMYMDSQVVLPFVTTTINPLYPSFTLAGVHYEILLRMTFSGEGCPQLTQMQEALRKPFVDVLESGTVAVRLVFV